MKTSLNALAVCTLLHFFPFSHASAGLGTGLPIEPGSLFWGGLEELTPEGWRESAPAGRARLNPRRLMFEANRGQHAEPVRFLARGPGYQAFFAENEQVMVLRAPQASSPGMEQPPAATERHVLRLSFTGAQPASSIAGERPLKALSHYFKGNDPAKWRSDIPNFAQIRYEEIYPGIDLVYYSNLNGDLEYDLILAPGTDPSLIRWTIQGADQAWLNDNGDLILKMGSIEAKWKAPKVLQSADGKLQPIPSTYELESRNDGGFDVAFKVAPYNEQLALVIDPIFVYATYLGGSGFDTGYGVAVDADDNAFLIGLTESADFPAKNAMEPIQVSAEGDVVVAKFDPAGDLLFSTFIGGEEFDRANGIALDAQGEPYVTGYTSSTEFPTVNAFQETYGGNGSSPFDAFVFKLSTDGSELIYSSYLGGNGFERPSGIAVDANGHAFVAGDTLSTNFPAVNALQAGPGGRRDGFLAKISPGGGNLEYSTYLGGDAYDSVGGVVTDSMGNAYVCGTTVSANFPIKNALFATQPGGWDGFLLKVNPSGSELLFSTYLGGPGEELDAQSDLALGTDGDIYMIMFTRSAAFPVLKPLQSSLRGPQDAVVMRIRGDGTSMAFSTFFGGSESEFLPQIAVDALNRVYVGMLSNSRNFPVRDPWEFGGTTPVPSYVSILAPDGQSLLFSSPIPAGAEFAGVSNGGTIYVVGGSGSSQTALPTANAFQPDQQGEGDAYIAVIDSPLTPEFRILRSGAELLLVWPRAFQSFHLQTVSALGESWFSIEEEPALIEDQWVVTIEPAEGSQFFRLIRQ